jgi:hypothetical protein
MKKQKAQELKPRNQTYDIARQSAIDADAGKGRPLLLVAVGADDKLQFSFTGFTVDQAIVDTTRLTQWLLSLPQDTKA